MPPLLTSGRTGYKYVLTIYSVSLGCPKNRVDTEHLLGGLGVEIKSADQPLEADCAIINTCGFIAPAVRESVRRIVETIDALADAGSKRPLLVVAGCLVGRYGIKDLAPDLPEVDLWLDNRDIAEWPARLAKALGLPEPAATGRLLSTGPSYAWLKISDGCEHKCAFCTIPAIRGPLRSRPAAGLKAEAEALLDQGVAELVLVAQDVSAWGRDLGKKHSLIQLLEDLLPLPGLERLRLMYLYPAGVTEELLRFLKSAGAPFVPYFDIPLQHAHPAILKKMGRPFSQNPRLVIERIRKHFPLAALRTSLIAGYPGETEAHFAALRDFVLETRFTNLGVFAFQSEEGTKAFDLPDQPPDNVKEWRRDSIMEIQAEISAAFLQTLVGTRLPILVDAPHDEWPGLHTGRAWFQAPEVDGVTYISGPSVAPGKIISAEITEAMDYDLVALA